ncbi:hypothetical protein COMA2_20003 [Candidatus Nitrospira nitrificans]|uniref:Uncharacterized protein n=1 Tax=Candidatus Nitrospira nitrificans TaxID=1742973 RepID=A0A0S4LE53_9BACT|nr:hypothetical protein COMA2_20003 [Candidatus Nitrospira nitrificans]
MNRIEVRGENQRRCRLKWPSVRKRCSDHIMVRAAQCLKGLLRDGEVYVGELVVQIGFCLLKTDRRGERMPLSNQAVEIFFESIAINGHVRLRDD